MKTLINVNREPAGSGFQAHWSADVSVWERADTWEGAAGKLAQRLGIVDLDFNEPMPPKEPEPA